MTICRTCERSYTQLSSLNGVANGANLKSCMYTEEPDWRSESPLVMIRLKSPLPLWVWRYRIRNIKDFFSTTVVELVVMCQIPQPTCLTKEARYLRVSDPINLLFYLPKPWGLAQPQYCPSGKQVQHVVVPQTLRLCPSCLCSNDWSGNFSPGPVALGSKQLLLNISFDPRIGTDHHQKTHPVRMGHPPV